MLDKIFQGLFDTDITRVISVTDFLLCIACALAAGVLLTGAYLYRTRSSKSFAVTLALLPTIVCVIIMMVNGNIGTGVAVAGAFGLVRFRSAQGTAREICAIFIAMGAGLICGMGYLAYALLFSLLMCAALMLCTHFSFGIHRGLHRTMHLTIPEDLDYTGVFDDIFEEYTTKHELTQVKTTNMGSLFRLTYDMTLRRPNCEKEMIDKLRCRNGNLEISVSAQETTVAEL